MLVVAFDNAYGDGDLVYDGGVLQSGASVETAALLSLFLDAPARPDDPVPEDAPRGGWWADAYADDGDVTGSRLWVLSYYSATGDAARFAEAAAREALQWMLDDGLAVEVIAEAARTDRNRIRLQVAIRKPGELAPSLLGAWDLEVGDAL